MVDDRGANLSIGEHWRKVDSLRMGSYYAKKELEFLGKHLESLSRDVKVLIFGCATEKEVLFLKKKGFHNLYGVDLDEESIERIKRSYGTKNFFTCDAEELSGSIKAQSYQLIVGIQVFDYLKKYNQFVAGLRELLAPEGLLVFSFSNRASVKAIAYRFYTKIFNKPKKFYKTSFEYQEKLYRGNGMSFVDSYGFNWNFLPRDSNSLFVGVFAFIERVLGLGRMFKISPTVIVAVKRINEK